MQREIQKKRWEGENEGDREVETSGISGDPDRQCLILLIVFSKHDCRPSWRPSNRQGLGTLKNWTISIIIRKIHISHRNRNHPRNMKTVFLQGVKEDPRTQNSRAYTTTTNVQDSVSKSLPPFIIVKRSLSATLDIKNLQQEWTDPKKLIQSCGTVN